ncbi:hypothetical protein H4696_003343 [Amycolatopsis lexingtonensis]|uniref:Uncharacterized protein n=1 Tax=Amycolatopsis lexingtonensis TaxID=218822 RepID=A0ABR9HZ76_9PSEU|nr:hypothetical protein [Amycolatopsis lexingtonensis]MBE1496243.1 hypothetical protein [Amycolatopsis lexingtonensis]
MWLDRLTEALSEDSYIQASRQSHYQMLAEAILNNQPEWVEAQRLVAVYEQALSVAAQLRRFTGQVALHSVDVQIMNLPRLGRSEFGQGYAAGMLAARRHHLSERLGSPPLPPACVPDYLLRPYDHDIELPDPETAAAGVTELLSSWLRGGRPADSAKAAVRLASVTTSVAQESLSVAQAHISEVQTEIADLTGALRAPGDLVVTNRSVSSFLRSELTTLSTAVRRSATPGSGFGGGFYAACEHVSQLLNSHAVSLRFARAGDRASIEW